MPSVSQRLIVPGDVVRVTIAEDGNAQIGGEDRRFRVDAEGKLRRTEEGKEGHILVQDNNAMLGVAVSGLTEGRAAGALVRVLTAYGAQCAKCALRVSFIEHIEKVEGAVGLIVNPQLVTLDLTTANLLCDPSRCAHRAAKTVGLDPNRCVVQAETILYEPGQVVGRSGAAIGMHVKATAKDVAPKRPRRWSRRRARRWGVRPAGSNWPNSRSSWWPPNWPVPRHAFAWQSSRNAWEA